MTDIEQKALEMISAARKEHPTPDNYLIARTALCRAIEQHEAFRQEVSGAVTALLDCFLGDGLSQGVINGHLHQFIIPKPQPDPLVEIIGEINDGPYVETKAEYADRIRAALDALNFEIRKKGK